MGGTFEDEGGAFTAVPCQNCGERAATERYAAGSLEATHGWWQKWCSECVKAAQREHALQCLPALTIEDLEDELRKRREGDAIVVDPETGRARVVEDGKTIGEQG